MCGNRGDNNEKDDYYSSDSACTCVWLLYDAYKKKEIEYYYSVGKTEEAEEIEKKLSE